MAEYFGKRHDHVLRDIDAHLAHAPNLGDEEKRRFAGFFILRDGAVYASSQDVANYFGKKHYDVLDDIDRHIGHAGNLPHEEKRRFAGFFVLRDGAVYASSQDVAEYFEKQHKHVLDTVDQLIVHGRNLGHDEKQRLAGFFILREVAHPSVPATSPPPDASRRVASRSARAAWR